MEYCEIRYLGQEGFSIRTERIQVCIDLYLSNSVYERTGEGIRKYPVPCEIDELIGVDYYLITHEHLDHMDPDTITKLSRLSTNTRFICPKPHMEILEMMDVDRGRIIGAVAGEKIILEGLTVYPIAEKHEEYNIINGDHGTLGYIMEMGNLRMYHSGDAIADDELIKELKSYKTIDIAFLPINGHDRKRFKRGIMGNMTYRDALDLCDEIGANIVVPMHYDLFANNTENPSFFVDYLYREYPTQKFKMFIPGEKMIVAKEINLDE